MLTDHPFIDIHTHNRPENDEACVCVVNCFAKDENMPASTKNTFYSMGLHPWHISTENIDAGLGNIENALINKTIVAIGETGLDRAIKTAMEFQKEVFAQHLMLAQKYDKPLIIHAVRSYPDIIGVYNKSGVNVQLIFHGFGGNIQTANQLIKRNFYLSFGRDLFHPKKKAADILKLLSPDKIFLETDDSKKSIQEVYDRASEIMGISVAELKKIIHHNFVNCFGNII